MKTLKVLFILLPFISGAQEVHKQFVNSEIKAVKLYLTAGQITHEQKVKVKQGRNKFVFTGISAYADPQSIQFLSSQDISLVAVSTEMDFLAAENFNPRIVSLKDSLELLNDELQANADIMSSYHAEQAVLNTNRDLGGNNQNLNVAQIKEAGEFYRTRTLEINKALSKLNKSQKRLGQMIESVRFQLVELNYNENQRSNQIVIIADVAAPGEIETTLRYLVSDCGWAATYDLSAEDIKHKINLKYRAQIYNNTGNDWTNVELTLSTSDPGLSASHPQLSPWYLTPYTVNSYGKSKHYVPQSMQQNYRQQAISDINIANQRVYDNYYNVNDKERGDLFSENSIYLNNNMAVGNNGVQIQQIEISELTAEFKIEKLFSCPSDAKPYLVDVKNMDLEATFSHISVPKLDRSAFLMAHIVGWQELDLIPGPTNVYFGGVYVGVSQIETRDVADTLSLSFGRDDKVIVMRSLKKEFSTKRVMGGNVKESFMYDIKVRNNREAPINIEIFDQIPISNDNLITVTTDQISEGKVIPETGEVSWRMSINPSDVLSKEIGYTVKYPKNMQVNVKRYRKAEMYKF